MSGPDTSARLPAAFHELLEELGSAAVLSADRSTARYVTPARGSTGAAAAVVRPASTDEVRTVVRWAIRHDVRLLPQGANTGLVGASTPDTTGRVAVVSLERMNRIERVDASDRVAVAQAGVRLSALNEHARDVGLMLPIDVSSDPMLGGMAATNTGGAQMIRYGDMRRRVLGVEAVIADGDATVLDDLSVLRKNNTGLAISSLLVGSSGALGIITRVAVELAARPVERSCAWLTVRSGEDAVALLMHLEQVASWWLSSFEVCSEEAISAGERLLDDGSPAPDHTGSLSVLVEFAGPAGAQDALVEALGAARSGLILDSAIAPPATAWALRHSISDGLRDLGTVIGFDVSVPRSALAVFREQCRDAIAAESPDATIADFGHWADGGIHMNVVVDPDTTPARRDRLREVVFGIAVDRFGGSFSAEHGIGPHNADWWLRSVSPGLRHQSAALCAAFDPHRILGHPGLPYSSSSAPTS